MTPVNLSLLLEIFDHLHVRRVPYVWGGKAPSLDCDSSLIGGLDCSGWTRYAIARATNQAVIIPDGSVNQHDWCEQQGLHKPDYKDAATLADASRLFICFLPPQTGHAGHVWFVNAGWTLESHGHYGIDSRVWNTPVLVRKVNGVYELPTASGGGVDAGTT